MVNHTSSHVARKHPDFEAAKHGDFDAAIRLVDDLVKDDKVLEVAEQYPDAHVAYIHRRQGNGINMIPAAYAAKFAALGMTVDDDIIAVTDAHKTQKRNEMTCYENSLQDVKTMLKKNSGYIVSEPFRRLQDDVRRYLDNQKVPDNQPKVPDHQT